MQSSNDEKLRIVRNADLLATENINRVATPEAIRASVKEEPWGRPGAGAPLKDSQGEIVKNTKGRIKYESMVSL